MGDLYLYLLLLFLAIWTARIAMSKGRNPWIWGGAALILGLMPGAVSLLTVGPLILLLFLSRSTSGAPAKAERLACPKCAQTRRPTQHFCTNCGWDLGQPYTPDGTEPVMAAEESAQEPSARPVEASDQSAMDPVIAQSAEASPAVEAPAVENQPAEAGAEGLGESASESIASDEPAAAGEEAVPEQPDRPWGMPEPGVAPTAAIMTERGMSRLNAGRVQEAIDQFTKAIALDPNYREAWERRAEAYATQGRGEEAAEDRRRIQGLNASSSPG